MRVASWGLGVGINLIYYHTSRIVDKRFRQT